MGDSDLTDDEIVDLLGDPPPAPPIAIPPDPQATARAEFHQRVADWLERRVDLIQVQHEHSTPDTLPTFLAELRKFVSGATPSHDCWMFSSPQSEWDRLAGRSGYALVANGKVTHVLVTIVS